MWDVNQLCDEALTFFYTETKGLTAVPFRLFDYGQQQGWTNLQSEDVYNHLLDYGYVQSMGSGILRLTMRGIFRAEELLLDSDLSDEIQAKSDKREAIFKHICQQNGDDDLKQFDLEEIAKSLGFTRIDANDTYNYLHAHGFIKPHGAGLYCLLTLDGYKYYQQNYK